MKKKTSVGSKIILTLTMLFFYLPILYIIIFSFNDSRSLTKFGGFSLRWYEKMFADSTMMEAVLYTVIIAVIATVVATVVGTITAIGLSKSRKVVQKMVERINDLPVMNPRYRHGHLTSDVFQRPHGQKRLRHAAHCAYHDLYPLRDALRYAEAPLARP